MITVPSHSLPLLCPSLDNNETYALSAILPDGYNFSKFSITDCSDFFQPLDKYYKDKHFNAHVAYYDLCDKHGKKKYFGSFEELEVYIEEFFPKHTYYFNTYLGLFCYGTIFQKLIDSFSEPEAAVWAMSKTMPPFYKDSALVEKVYSHILNNPNLLFLSEFELSLVTSKGTHFCELYEWAPPENLKEYFMSSLLSEHLKNPVTSTREFASKKEIMDVLITLYGPLAIYTTSDLTGVSQFAVPSILQEVECNYIYRVNSSVGVAQNFFSAAPQKVMDNTYLNFFSNLTDDPVLCELYKEWLVWHKSMLDTGVTYR